ncbi:hypothetical protein DITRI_Ditri02bG0052900 [Diplodiscus trichospermus]
MPGSGKKTRGRQKIELKKIENEDDRLVSFSKRRSGIYKKASEMATLCGAEIGLIVSSPTGKPFSYGHPSLESVANRYLKQNPSPNDNTYPLVEAYRKAKVDQLSQQLAQILSKLDAEKKKAKMLDQQTPAKETQGWWEAPIDELNQKELVDLYSTYEEFRTILYSAINMKSAEASTSSLPAPVDPAQSTNIPFATKANEDVPAIFPAGYDAPGRQQL